MAHISAQTHPGSSTQARERRPLVGTRWPPASAPRIPHLRDGSHLSTDPPGQRSTQARERRPLVGTRWPPASAPRIPHLRDGSHLSTDPPGQRSTQARERRPLVGTRWPPASAPRIPHLRDGSHLSTYPPGSAARRPGNADLWSARAGLRPAHRASPISVMAHISAQTHRAAQHAGQGTPTSGRHALASGQRTAHPPSP